MKVSLVTTVKDAAGAIDEFLASIDRQTRTPDEVVVVDGGSTDGTVARLRRTPGITLVEERGANIARGRNLAIAVATHEVIAVTDADCVLEPEWLERLLGPLESGADVAMGFYLPIAEGFLESCMACVNLPDPEEVDEAAFAPSARSVAFRREAIEAAGGYPEWLDIGEDQVVDRRWRELGLDLRFVPDAIVRWRLRASLRETWVQYFRYARGDAIAGLYPERHALRFTVYGAALLAWGSRGRVRRAATVAAGGAYVARPIRRAMARFDDPARRAAAVAAIPALMAFVDLAKMAGYLAGIPNSRSEPSATIESP
jgi:glycosyltransferase involved in cell wall biosynthesis